MVEGMITSRRAHKRGSRRSQRILRSRLLPLAVVLGAILFHLLLAYWRFTLLARWIELLMWDREALSRGQIFRLASGNAARIGRRHLVSVLRVSPPMRLLYRQLMGTAYPASALAVAVSGRQRGQFRRPVRHHRTRHTQRTTGRPLHMAC